MTDIIAVTCVIMIVRQRNASKVFNKLFNFLEKFAATPSLTMQNKTSILLLLLLPSSRFSMH